MKEEGESWEGKGVLMLVDERGGRGPEKGIYERKIPRRLIEKIVESDK